MILNQIRNSWQICTKFGIGFHLKSYFSGPSLVKLSAVKSIIYFKHKQKIFLCYLHFYLLGRQYRMHVQKNEWLWFVKIRALKSAFHLRMQMNLIYVLFTSVVQFE